MSTMISAATARHHTDPAEYPMPLWLTAWIGATMLVLILNFDSIMWNRVPVTFAALGPAPVLDMEQVKAVVMLVSALTPLVIGLVTATFSGVAKVMLARRGKPTSPDSNET